MLLSNFHFNLIYQLSLLLNLLQSAIYIKNIFHFQSYLDERRIYISHWKKTRWGQNTKCFVTLFSKRQPNRGNRVSSRLLDPPSHNNLTQAWRVKPWPGIQGVLRGSSIPEFQAFKVDLSNLTDFYERSFKSESTIDPVARVPEKGRDRWNKGIIKTNSWYSW